MVCNMLNALKSYKKPLTKEEEEQEFQSLFQLLSSMASNGAPRIITIDDTLDVPIISNEVLVPDTPPSFQPNIVAEEVVVVHTPLPLVASPLAPAPVEKNPDEPVKRGRGRPKRVVHTDPSALLQIQNPCEACGRSVRKNKKWKHNYEHSMLCTKWMKFEEKEKLSEKANEPFHSKIYELLLDCVATTEHPNQCRYCEVTFLNRSNLHSHLSRSIVCNRFAYVFFKKKMNEIYL
jgi:hypothetical protein